MRAPTFFIFLRRKELRAAGGLFSYRVGNNVLSVAMNCETMLATVLPTENIIEENVVQEHMRMPPPCLNNEDMLY